MNRSIRFARVFVGMTLWSLGGLLLSLQSEAAIYPGEVDPHFNAPVFGGSPIAEIVRALLALPDGSVWVGGNFSDLNRRSVAGLVKLLPDGTPDGSLVDLLPEPQSDADVYFFAPLPDKSLYVLGWNGSLDLSPSTIAWKLTPEGNMDRTFSPVRSDGNATGGAILPDGRLVVAGEFTQINGVARTNIAVILPSGQLDLTFNAGGLLTNAQLRFAAVDAAGRIYAGGGYVAAGKQRSSGVVRLLPDGKLDPTFDSGIYANSLVYSFLPEADGSFLVGGALLFPDTSRGVVRLTSSGAVDPNFFPIANLFREKATALSRGLDGELWVASRNTSSQPTRPGPIARLRPDGHFDTNFATTATFQAGQPPRTLAVGPNGDVFAGGSLQILDENSRQGVVKLPRVETINTARPSHEATITPKVFYARRGEGLILSSTTTLKPTLSIQWFRNGQPLLRETNASLVLPEIGPGDAATYTVAVTSSKGRAVSPPAFVALVQAEPLTNDADSEVREWFAWPSWGWHLQTETVHEGTSAFACSLLPSQGTLRLETVVTGPAVVTFWHTFLHPGLGDNAVIGLEEDEIFMQGRWNWRLYTRSVPAGRHIFRFGALATAAGFRTQMGLVTMDSFKSTPTTNIPPKLLSAPRPKQSELGGVARFTVVGESPFAISYQWFKNGTPIPGATHALLELKSLSASDEADYSVTLSNEIGSTPSASAHLTLVPFPPAPELQISSSSVGSPLLKVSGELGASYEVEASNDLQTWSRLGPFVMEETPTALNLQPGEPLSHRFYRATRR